MRAIDERRALAGRVVGRGGNGRNHGVMLRHALASFYPGGARGGGARAAAQRGRAGAAAGAPAAGSGRHQLRDLPARRADRHRADRGQPRRQRLDHRQLRTHRRAARRRRAPAAGPLHRRLEADRVHPRRYDARAGRRRFTRSIDGTTAKSEGSVAGQPIQKTDAIDARALLLLPTNFFGPYEALAARLKTAAPGSTIPAYLVPPAVDRDHRRRVVGGTDPDDRPPGQRAAHAHRAGAARRTPRRRALDRRRGPDDPVQRAAAGARGRARGHRRGLVAQRHHLAAERRSRSTSPATASRSPGRCRGRCRPARRGCRRSCWSAAAARPIATSLVVGIPIFGQIADALADCRLHRRALRQARRRPERRPRRSRQRSRTTPTMCAPR